MYLIVSFREKSANFKLHPSASPKLKIEPLQDLKGILDSGNDLPFPDGLLINGQGWNGNRVTEIGRAHV